jgi:hypothetical protein
VTAILASSLAHNRLETQLLALAGFVGVQIFTYVVTLLYLYTCILQPAIFSRVPSHEWPLYIFLTCVGIVLFFAIREALIHLLWRATLHRLQAHPSEWDNLGVKFAKEWVV